MIISSPVTQPAVIALPTSCDQKPVEVKERSSPTIRTVDTRAFRRVNQMVTLGSGIEIRTIGALHV
jgi:hypothetical protein